MSIVVPSLADRIAEELVALVRRGETVGYGELARRLGVPGPGSIAALTRALEALMVEDAAAGRPFRAALCEGKLRGGLPAPGFFEAARRLGRFSGPLDGPEAEAFVAGEREALFARSADQL
ncbi:MAG: hypothetical protein IOC92_05010 [Rhodobacter sp.]|nr:hypothetical protein [Rhodobacter sp.]MCA3456011.1 hypothetical protein [Rhodobacter sp.]MCA3460532.1 hypothetical protein [Rhodobacter sp.]MCA3463888.1 hypothetical protein [Rhodobacter sp.]MCA3468298.1 hypothetical protein [Rhodobacter sp.]